jgi:Phytanoyl-CoA dioxygenase (PhyH)
MSVLSNLRGRKTPADAETTPSPPSSTEPATTPSPTAATNPVAPTTATPGGHRLSQKQLAFFETFGFVRLPGLFAPDVDRLVDGFEEVFDGNESWDTNEALHFNERRRIIPLFIDRTERLSWLNTDPRITDVVSSLIDRPWETAGSDGNLFYCDTSWHPDSYAAPMHIYHVKLSFYLDPLHGENGAIRMIPGTNFHRSEFAGQVRENTEDPEAIRDIYGVGPDEIPSWTLESEPGDVIAWNFRTIHASFNGGQRRRLFSLNFREVTEDS